MTIKDVLSFGLVASDADVRTLFDSIGQSTRVLIGIGGGRFGGNSIRIKDQGSFGGASATKNFPAAITSGLVSVAINWDGKANDQIAIQDGVTTQIRFRINIDGRVELFLDPSTSLDVSTDPVMTAGVYKRITMKYTISNTVGVVTVRDDDSGSDVLSFSGDTQRTGNATVDRVILGGTNGSNPASDTHFDDLIIQDQIAPNGDFLGDVVLDKWLPDFDSTPLQWVTTGGDHFGEVDDAAPDGDTTNVQHDVVGEIDRLGFGDTLASTDSIISMVGFFWARKDDAGGRSARLNAVSGASVGTGADKALSTAYEQYREIFDTDPQGGGSKSGSHLSNTTSPRKSPFGAI